MCEPFYEHDKAYLLTNRAEWDPIYLRAVGQRLLTQVATLRAALLQSQEALKALSQKWEDAAVWECDEMSNQQSAQTFDQCAHELFALLSPPVAPKAECMCGQQGSADRFQCHGGGRRCGCSCHSSVAPKER